MSKLIKWIKLNMKPIITMCIVGFFVSFFTEAFSTKYWLLLAFVCILTNTDSIEFNRVEDEKENAPK